MRLAWATDVHLNFVTRDRAARFASEVVAADVDALLLGGDTAEGVDLDEWLEFLAEAIRRPIHFVLGNHDYYATDVAGAEARARAQASPWLNYLGGAMPVPLTRDLALVGHGGWADAGYGDFLGTDRVISDHFLIQDLRECAGGDDPLAILGNRPALARKLRELGAAAAAELEPSLRAAVDRFPSVCVLTHIPPFPELATHRGRPCDARDLPGNACRAIGELLLDVAAGHPDCRISVLSGHTHDAARCEPLPNLRAQTQAATYGEPAFRILSEEC